VQIYVFLLKMRPLRMQVDRNLASRSANLFAAHASTMGTLGSSGTTAPSLLGAGSSLERAPGHAAALSSPSAPAQLSSAQANGSQL
jgi:hypothetical protein